MSRYHFDPATYAETIRAEVPRYDELQHAAAAAAATPGYDRPDRLDELLAWLAEAGFAPTVEWAWKDCAVVRADLRG